MEKIKQTFIDLAPLNKCIDELIDESIKISSVLDSISECIRRLETKLEENKLHFPFKQEIEKKVSSPKYNLKKEHVTASFVPEGYSVVERVYFSWELQEDSKDKSYRLYLIIEESDRLFGGIEEYYSEYELDPIVVFKKRFIDTPLAIRLKYIRHFADFSSSFKDMLKKWRDAIQFTELALFQQIYEIKKKQSHSSL